MGFYFGIPGCIFGLVIGFYHYNLTLKNRIANELFGTAGERGTGFGLPLVKKFH